MRLRCLARIHGHQSDESRNSHLGREHWGQGYVTAAARLTLERVRAAGVPEVVAMVDAGNARSIAVTRRLGMRFAEEFTGPDAGRTAHCYRLDL